MSNKKQLQIKQLNPSGQLLNCINCYSGQISVFRASSQSAIQPYLNALAGIAGPEKFAIEIDHEPYLPYQHRLIGFGERFSANDGVVEDFLVNNGLPGNIIRSVLTSYGLENCMGMPCMKISRDEERRLRIIAAVYDQNKILVINEPFDPISSEWRERFAELIVNYARTRGQIVVIPHLSYRPECWIDNEFISRIQVGESLQKTIGLPSQSVDLNSMLAQLRQEHAEPQPPKEEPKPRNTETIKRSLIQTNKVRQKEEADLVESYDYEDEIIAHHVANNRNFMSQYRSHLKVAAVLLLLITGGLLFNKQKSGKLSEELANQKIAQQELDLLPTNKNNNLNKSSNVEVENVQKVSNIPRVDTTIEEQSNEPSIQKAALIMRYPDDIKSSIIAAVEAKYVSSTLEPKKTEIDKKKEQTNQVASDFLKLLESASSNEAPTGEDNGYDHVDSSTSEEIPSASAGIEAPPEDEQARREQIRQKFLEAIQRAQERSQ